MPASAHLRNAFLILALTLGTVGAVVGARYGFAADSEFAFVFQAVGTAAAVVLCVWSNVFFIRAVSDGATMRRVGMLWLALILAMAAPSAYMWAMLGDVAGRAAWLNVACLYALPVALPAIAMAAALAGLTVLAARRWQRRSAYAGGVVLVLLAEGLYVPGALYVMSAAMAGGTDDPAWQRWVVLHTPDWIKIGADRICDGTGLVLFDNLHVRLCAAGLLPLKRAEENLNDTNLKAAGKQWSELSARRPREFMAVVGDIAFGRITVGGPFYLDVAYANGGMYSGVALIGACGEFLEGNGNDADIADALAHIHEMQAPARDAFIRRFMEQGRNIPNIESIMLHGDYADPEGLRVLIDQLTKLGKNKEAFGAAEQRKWYMYQAWLYLKSPMTGNIETRKQERAVDYNVLLQSCHDPDFRLRRAAVFVLADVIHFKLQHTPFFDAANEIGAPVPMTQDEEAEMQALCKRTVEFAGE